MNTQKCDWQRKLVFVSIFHFPIRNENVRMVCMCYVFRFSSFIFFFLNIYVYIISYLSYCIICIDSVPGTIHYNIDITYPSYKEMVGRVVCSRHGRYQVPWFYRYEGKFSLLWNMIHYLAGNMKISDSTQCARWNEMLRRKS